MDVLKKTSLETTVDVKDTLEYKMNYLKAEGKDIQTSLADYIYMATNSIKSQLDELKELKSQIKSREDTLKMQDGLIKEGTADFLLDMGIDKLQGNLVSSVTLTKAKDATTKEVYSLIVDKKEAEQYLINAGLAVMETKEVPATKAKVRVNNRKLALSEVVE